MTCYLPPCRNLSSSAPIPSPYSSDFFFPIPFPFSSSSTSVHRGVDELKVGFLSQAAKSFASYRLDDLVSRFIITLPLSPRLFSRLLFPFFLLPSSRPASAIKLYVKRWRRKLNNRKELIFLFPLVSILDSRNFGNFERTELMFFEICKEHFSKFY